MRKSPTGNKPLKKRHEESLFLGLCEWLDYGERRGSGRRLRELAAALREEAQPELAELLLRLAQGIRRNEDARSLTASLKRPGGDETNGVLGVLFGRLYQRCGESALALRTLKSALEQASWHYTGEAHAALAQVHMERGETDKAREALLKALGEPLVEDRGRLFNALGALESERGQREAARNAFLEAARSRRPLERALAFRQLDDLARPDAPMPLDLSGPALPASLRALIDRSVFRLDPGHPAREELSALLARLIPELERERRLENYRERLSPRLIAELEGEAHRAESGKLRRRPLLEALSRKRLFLTALKVRIHGFTAHFKTLDPEDQIRFSDDFLGRLAETVFRYGGSLDSLQPMTATAYFGTLDPEDEPTAHTASALDAMEAAFALQHELIAFFREVKKHFFELPVERIRLKKGGYDLRQRSLGLAIGVSSGWCHFGESETAPRGTRLAVGHTVNLAQRLTECARPREVLTSQTTYDLLTASGAERFRFEGVTSQVILEPETRVYRLKDYENQPIYRVSLPDEEDKDPA